MALESKNLLVAVKAYSRANPLPLDASSVYESYDAAQAYAAAANSYAGQVITAKLEDGKYHTYVLDGESAPYTLTEIGIDVSKLKHYVQIVAELPGEGQEQGVIYVNTTDGTGSTWNGSGWTTIFEDVKSTEAKIQAVADSLDEYARLDGATFTGTVTLSADPSQNLEAATKQYVDRLISGINSFTPGIVDQSDNQLPTTDYEVGQMFRVTESGEYAGQQCEVGDLIIVIKDYAEEGAGDADFLIVQANIDGAVSGPAASTDANIVVFDGITGKKIKDSSVTLASLQSAISQAHTHSNKQALDTYTKTQEELIAEVNSGVSTQIQEIQTQLENKVDTSALENYYNKTEIDQQRQTLENSINGKIGMSDLTAKLGEIGDGTVKEYVDQAVADAKGQDWTEQINQAKTEAMAYTDQALTMTEFV